MQVLNSQSSKSQTSLVDMKFSRPTKCDSGPFLSISYRNPGMLQVFQLQDVQNVKLLADIKVPGRDVFRSVVLDRPFRHRSGQFGYGSYPLVAMATRQAQDGQVKSPKYFVQFYSLHTQEILENELSFDEPITWLDSNRYLFVVMTQYHVYLYRTDRPLSDGPATKFPVYPSPVGCLSLGKRWMAFPSKYPITNSALDLRSFGQTFTEISVDVAKKTAVSMLSFGTKSISKMKEFINQQQQKDENFVPTSMPQYESRGSDQEIPELSNVSGIIEIRDCKTFKLIAHFRAHKKPLCTLRFDPSGTLLATASTLGTQLNIFRIIPKLDGKVASKQIHHLYKLHRGLTAARIKNVHFSINSKWLAVTSVHGTTHTYAINPQGGKTSHGTHNMLVNRDMNQTPYYNHIHPIVISPVNRIHRPMNQKSENTPISAMFYTVNDPLPSEQLFLCTNRGLLSYHMMSPDVENQKTFVVNSKQIRHWKIENHPGRSDVKKDSITWTFNDQESQDEQSLPDQENFWISNVEINTFKRENPMWTTGNFKFKVFQEKSTNCKPLYPTLKNSQDYQDIRNQELDLTQSVFIKATNPIPLSPQESSTKKEKSTSGFSSLLTKAMGTPMKEEEEEQSPNNWEIIPPKKLIQGQSTVEEMDDKPFNPYFDDTNIHSIPVDRMKSASGISEPHEVSQEKGSLWSMTENYFNTKEKTPKASTLRDIPDFSYPSGGEREASGEKEASGKDESLPKMLSPPPTQFTLQTDTNQDIAPLQHHQQEETKSERLPPSGLFDDFEEIDTDDSDSHSFFEEDSMQSSHTNGLDVQKGLDTETVPPLQNETEALQPISSNDIHVSDPDQVDRKEQSQKEDLSQKPGQLELVFEKEALLKESEKQKPQKQSLDIEEKDNLPPTTITNSPVETTIQDNLHRSVHDLLDFKEVSLHKSLGQQQAEVFSNPTHSSFFSVSDRPDDIGNILDQLIEANTTSTSLKKEEKDAESPNEEEIEEELENMDITSEDEGEEKETKEETENVTEVKEAVSGTDDKVIEEKEKMEEKQEIEQEEITEPTTPTKPVLPGFQIQPATPLNEAKAKQLPSDHFIEVDSLSMESISPTPSFSTGTSEQTNQFLSAKSDQEDSPTEHKPDEDSLLPEIEVHQTYHSKNGEENEQQDQSLKQSDEQNDQQETHQPDQTIEQEPSKVSSSQFQDKKIAQFFDESEISDLVNREHNRNLLDDFSP